MTGTDPVRKTSMMRSYRVSIRNIGSISVSGTAWAGSPKSYTNYEEDFTNMVYSGPGAE
jgi:hypothetical protein